MDKFTLFELHVHDGMEFSAMNTASPFGRSSDDDEIDEEMEEFLDDIDIGPDESVEPGPDETDDDSSGRSPLALVVGFVFLVAVAVALRKLRSADADLEIADLDDFSDDYEEQEEAEL
jgi:hypothetical protein